MHNVMLIGIGVVVALVLVGGGAKVKAWWAAWRAAHPSLVARVEAIEATLEAKAKAEEAAIIAKIT